MSNKALIAATVILLVIVGGIFYFKSGAPTPSVSEPTPTVTDTASSTPDTGASTGTPNVSAIVGANTQFALELYATLKKTAGNMFFSPYSLSSALAMTYEGARGKTADEIQSVFHFPADTGVRRASFLALNNHTNAPSATYQLSIANALWVEKSYPLLSSYTGAIEQYYGGKATTVDFKGAAEAARTTINQWVEDNTNDKIKDLFPAGSLDDLTRLVLTNAIYFKGTWVKQFEKNETTPAPFRVSSTKSVNVPMMQRTDKDAQFTYAETAALQVLEMPYEGGILSMLVLLPKQDSLIQLESSLSRANLTIWKSALKEQRVDVFMPKFTVNTKYTMNDTLSGLGMPTAFTQSADFSGMDGTQSLSIQKVIHQAFVAVDEEGTEAAAATGVSVGITSAGPERPVFRADHPFIFIIQDTTNGNILFLGRVADPSA